METYSESFCNHFRLDRFRLQWNPWRFTVMWRYIERGAIVSRAILESWKVFAYLSQKKFTVYILFIIIMNDTLFFNYPSLKIIAIYRKISLMKTKRVRTEFLDKKRKKINIWNSSSFQMQKDIIWHTCTEKLLFVQKS